MLKNELGLQIKLGILRWYDLPEGSSVFVDGDNKAEYEEYLKGCGYEVVSSRPLEGHERSVDCIISVRALEHCSDPVSLLKDYRSFLSPDGRLLLGMNNRLAVRYFCGDTDPYTGKVFDGIDDYVEYGREQVMQYGGRCYSRAEIVKMLVGAGFASFRQYTVMPSLDEPQLLYREDVLPEEDLAMRYIPMYNNAAGIFMNEGKLYDTLIENGLFHVMGNSFLFECSMNGELLDIEHATLSLDRGEERSVITVLCEDEARKVPVYPEGENKLKEIMANHERLKEHGIKVIDGKWENGALVMPRIYSPLGNVYLQDLLMKDVDAFLEAMDGYRDMLLSSSEVVGESEYGPIMKHAYFDMVPLNAFVVDGEFVFYDQEFAIDDYPMNAILYRTIVIIYDGNMHREMRYSSYELFKRYGMEQHLDDYTRMTQEFLLSLRNQDERTDYNRKHFRNFENIRANRERIQTMTMKNEDIKATCFDDIGYKKIVVFGSGKYADKFMALYKDEYEIIAVVDNDAAKQGQEFRGMKIQSPDVLSAMKPDYYKVIICVKNYYPIYEQLLEMGVTNIGAYDFWRVYPGRQTLVPTLPPSDKKYHIGYCAGVYDLFHIGHVNIFRRAKEKCDYLIVGVVSDECVIKNKSKEAFIPFEERIAMVRSCRYVDEAVEIPYGYERSIEAFEKLHFDCQFSGSDYENDEGWLNVKRWLEERGSEMEFFPYTQQTSSTKIQGLIEKGLV